MNEAGAAEVRVLVTGAGGQLGRELAEILPGRGHETVALSFVELEDGALVQTFLA